MKSAKLLAVFCLGLLLMPAIVHAGNASKRGTAGALEILLPVGGRGTALAGTASASMVGVEAIHWNPAGLSRGWGDRSIEAMFSHMNYFADIKLDYAALGWNIGDFGTLGLTFRTVNFGDIAETTEDMPEGTGRLFSPTYFTLGVTYSKMLTDRIYIGFTGKFISESILRTNASGFALDGGVIYYVGGNDGWSGLHFGVVLKNIGPNMKYTGAELEESMVPPGSAPGAAADPLEHVAQSFELPSSFALGIGYDYRFDEAVRGTLMGEFENINFGNDRYRIGGEIAYNEQFFLRGGFQGTDGSSNEYIWGPSFGAGVMLPLGSIGIVVDYSYQTTDVFQGTNTFSLLIRF